MHKASCDLGYKYSIGEGCNLFWVALG